MTTANKNSILEPTNILHMYEIIHNSVTLLDPITSQWYSVPRHHAKEIEPYDDMWNVLNNYDYLRIEAWRWMRDTKEDFFKSNFVDTPAGYSIVLHFDDKTFAITETLYHQIQADLETAGADPTVKSGRGKTQDIFIDFREPEIIGGDETAHYRCGDLVLYHAAEVKIIDDADIPF